MQYLLTQEEFSKLGSLNAQRLQQIVIDELRKALVEAKEYPCKKGYCDDCPIVKIHKMVAERCPEFDLKMFCELTKDFSK